MTGRQLASAEAFTWLGEHFQTPLSLVKRAADWLYLSGVNHLLFHGIPYSPLGEPWPGYQFYASVNFGPAGGLWRDLPALNAYLTRVQSILQAGDPDVDLLLYYSPHDAWHEPNAPSKPDDLAPQNPVPPAFEELGLRLWRRGYAWDAVSEARLADARVDGGRLRLGNGAYRAVVVPRTRLLSPAAARRLAALARDGASVVFVGGLPGDVPGFGALETRRQELRAALAGLEASGRVLQGDDAEPLLVRLGVPREAMTDAGLQYVRRRHAAGRDYFVVNRSETAFDGWLPLASPAKAAALLDPLASDRVGTASVRAAAAGPGRGPPAARARRVARRADPRSGRPPPDRRGPMPRPLGRPCPSRARGPSPSSREARPCPVRSRRGGSPPGRRSEARTRSASRAPRATSSASSGRPQRPPTGSSTSATCARAHGSS